MEISFKTLLYFYRHESDTQKKFRFKSIRTPLTKNNYNKI